MVTLSAASMMSNQTTFIDRLPAILQGRIHHFRQHAARRSFAWNVSIMLVGTVAGQAVSLLLSPVLTRLYSPTQFGYLSVYGAVLAIFGVVASLGLELAIPICMAEAECANLLALNGLVLTGTTTLVALCAWLIPAHTLNAAWVGSLADYRWLLPIGFACLGGYYIMVAVATRNGAFKDIARTRISQGVSGPVSQILLALLGAGTPGLVLGYVIGQSSGTLLLLTRFMHQQRAWLAQINWRGVVAVTRRYITFPLLASWARVFDMAGSGTVLFVLISACYSPEIAGFMFLSDRVIARPLYMVSTSLLQVFIGEAGRAVTQDPVLLRRRFYQVVPRQFVLVDGLDRGCQSVGRLGLPAAVRAAMGRRGALPAGAQRVLSDAVRAASCLDHVATARASGDRGDLAGWPTGVGGRQRAAVVARGVVGGFRVVDQFAGAGGLRPGVAGPDGRLHRARGRTMATPLEQFHR